MPASYNDALGQVWAVDVEMNSGDRIVFQSGLGIRVADCEDRAFGERVKDGAVSLPELRPYFVRSRAPAN